MVRKIDVTTPAHSEPYGNPVPLGLLGLGVGCAALTPIAFGHGLEPAGLKTAALLCLLFGGCCQFLTGYMEFRNRNAFAGAVFTLFSFNWVVTAWELYAISVGFIPHHGIKLAVDIALLMILAPLTVGFGYFSKSLVLFLVDIDLLYVCKIVKGFTGTQAVNLPIAALTVGLGLMGIWIALATLINPVVGRQVFRIAGPLFFARRKRFDFSTRRAIFDVLYARWKERAFEPMPLEELQDRVKDAVAGAPILPDVHYLWEFGYLDVTTTEANEIRSVRLNARGIDLHEQLVLGKWEV
ncbi:MAG: hypothetical protein HY815_19125 [Candidatus Riflebacteria bacterium]|nr:hypothetical protein [Candidatus Riflebacteria bacterium]